VIPDRLSIDKLVDAMETVEYLASRLPADAPAYIRESLEGAYAFMNSVVQHQARLSAESN